MIEIVTHLPDRSPSHDGSLAWLFIFTFGEGLFLALFFCAPFFPLFGGCLYFHLQAMLHSSVTAKPRHCAWCLYMHVWQHKTLGSGFMLMWQKSKRGFTPNCSLMCLTNCGSHSQHPSPNTLWETNTKLLFPYWTKCVWFGCMFLEVFIRDHSSTFCPGEVGLKAQLFSESSPSFYFCCWWPFFVGGPYGQRRRTCCLIAMQGAVCTDCSW